MSVELAFEPQVIPITAFVGKHMRFMEICIYIYIYTQYKSIKISRYQHALRSATHGFTAIYHKNYYYIDLSSSIL